MRGMELHLPDRIRALPRFDGPIDAFRLAGNSADTLLAAYPAGTAIPPHNHDTENHGVITRGRLYLTLAGEERAFGVGEWYEVPRGAEHAARFEEDTEIIEFWFPS